MKNKIITINREFGSGGREVGKRLADILQIPYYDSEIVTQIAQRTQFAEDYIRSATEKGAYIPFPITIGRSFYPSVNQYMTQTNTIYLEQSKILAELAEKSDCIIVGRCANHVLSEYDPLRIFIYADIDFKVKRCRDYAPEHENMTNKQLIKRIQEINKDRANYYKFVTGTKWDDKTNYDLCINTTNAPIKLAAGIVAQFSHSVAENS